MQIMKISKIRIFKLGIFIISGVIIFIVAVYYLGKQDNIFRSGITIFTEFNDVKGLRAGNNVRYLGTYAGYVSSIGIISDTIVKVEMVIDHGMSDFIRENSKVEIQNDGVMGSKIIVIHPGTSDYNTIRANSKLPPLKSMSIEEIFGALEGTVDYTTRAAENLYLVSQNVLEGKGILGKFIYDEELPNTFDELTSNLISISKETHDILIKLNTADNDLGKLINEDNISTRVMNSFDNVDSILLNLSASSDELKKATQALNNQEGLIQKLLHDSILSKEVDTTVVKLNHALENVSETSEVIKRSWIFNLFPRRRKSDND